MKKIRDLIVKWWDKLPMGNQIILIIIALSVLMISAGVVGCRFYELSWHEQFICTECNSVMISRKFPVCPKCGCDNEKFLRKVIKRKSFWSSEFLERKDVVGNR